MHRSFFAVKDTFINSGSNPIDGTSYLDKNTGQDEILEIKKVFFNSKFDYPTRTLIQFDANDIKNYISSSVLPHDYKDVLKIFDLKHSVNAKKSYGGTSFANIKKMIKTYKKLYE